MRLERPKYFGGAYSRLFSALAVLMDGYEILEETGAIFGEGSSRIDGLLVPVSPAAHCMSVDTRRKFFARPRVLGVEVKTNRADFLRGLKERQFVRYAERMHGLYVLTYSDVCKTSEVPEGIGHIVVQHRRGIARAICRRHPVLRELELPNDVMWRLVFALTAARDARDRADIRRDRDYRKLLGDRAGAYIFRALAKLERSVVEDLEEPGWTRRGGVDE